MTLMLQKLMKFKSLLNWPTPCWLNTQYVFLMFNNLWLQPKVSQCTTDKMVHSG